jgi:hypothetical protein
VWAILWRVRDSGRDANLARGRLAGGNASASSSGPEDSEGRHGRFVYLASPFSCADSVRLAMRRAQRLLNGRALITSCVLRASRADAALSAGGVTECVDFAQPKT